MKTPIKVFKADKKCMPIKVMPTTEAAKADVSELLSALQSSLQGLSTAEAESRLKQYGLNEFAQEKKHHWLIQLLRTFNSPFNYLLLTLGAVAYVTGSWPTLVMILTMVLLSVLLRFIQEYRSSKAAEKLKALVSTTATVTRSDSSGMTIQEVPLNRLVPGDIISLTSGNLIPADVRLISARELFINQSALTGEAMPVHKHAEIVTEKIDNPLELDNTCFMGSSVVSGIGQAVVITTGSHTYFGSLAREMVTEEVATGFDKGITALSWLLIRFILSMVVLIFVINSIAKGNWLEAFLFSLAVGIGLTPEMLPMIITTNLAKGALRMSDKKVVVKRLSSIQDLGAMDILCTDKTGTLTQNKIILYKHFNLHGEESLDVLKYAFLNSYFQTGLKNMLDVAILTHAEEDDSLKSDLSYRKLDEIPFDFLRRRMSVVLETTANTHLLICKGAVEEIFSVCSHIMDKGKLYPIHENVLHTLQATTQALNADGFRVIAIAYKEIPATQTRYSVSDESDLTLMGYISFLDPPKESTAIAIADLHQLGVQVKILTGDNEIITQKICKTVNLPIQNIMLGKDIDALSDSDLTQAAEKTTIFAKLTPGHKQRIIEALQRAKHVVGFLGDGINDSPALKTADVGISVNNAVDIAKESADMILLEQSLLVLKDGVVEGRKVFGNIIKYIRMTTSSNFGNVVSMVGASALLPFLPMKPIHILIQNLLYDLSQTALPFDNVDPEYIEKPYQWHVENISRFMITFGPVSSIFDYTTFALMWFVFQANTIEKQALFQSGWFIEGLLSQTLIIHLIRTRRIPFIESWAAPPVLFSTLLIMAIGIYLPFSPLAPIIGMTPLPATYFLWLTTILITYFALTQFVKYWFIKRFGF